MQAEAGPVGSSLPTSEFQVPTFLLPAFRVRAFTSPACWFSRSTIYYPTTLMLPSHSPSWQQHQPTVQHRKQVPETIEAMAQGWSSLPADLVNRVADCLLATNDLDCYVDLRAVCHHWRSVTADPRSQHDLRFRPSRWVMLDEDKLASFANTDGVALLFVNTATGRLLRRSLPLLRNRDRYIFVTSTTDGLLVLAAKDPPHAVSVLNPFTGSITRFAAPAPLPFSYSGPRFTAVVVGSSPTLVMVSVARRLVYWAEPQSESFSVEKKHEDCPPASRLPLIAAAGKCAAVNRESVPGADNIFDQFWSDADEGCRCYAVAAAGGDMLAVLNYWRRDGVDVFKVDASGNVVDRVKSIGSQALFLGIRCLVVDTDYFPTVEPNCAYFQFTNTCLDQYIYKFSIGRTYCHEEPEPVSAMGNMRPWTLTQLLCNYTMDIPVPGHPLTWEQRLSDIDFDSENFIYRLYMSFHCGYLTDFGDF